MLPVNTPPPALKTLPPEIYDNIMRFINPVTAEAFGSCFPLGSPEFNRTLAVLSKTQNHLLWKTMYFNNIDTSNVITTAEKIAYYIQRLSRENMFIPPWEYFEAAAGRIQSLLTHAKETTSQEEINFLIGIQLTHGLSPITEEEGSFTVIENALRILAYIKDYKRVAILFEKTTWMEEKRKKEYFPVKNSITPVITYRKNPNNFNIICSSEYGLLDNLKNILQETKEQLYTETIGFALFEAAHWGHIAIIQFLLEKEEEHCSSHSINEAFQIAAYWSRLDIVELLLQEKGSHLFVDMIENVLAEAIQQNFPALIQLLLVYKKESISPQEIEKALMHASDWGHTAIVACLLEHHEDPIISDLAIEKALYQATHSDHAEIVELFLNKKVHILEKAIESLFQADLQGNMRVVNCLVRKKGAQIFTIELKYVLSHPQKKSHFRILEILLEHPETPLSHEDIAQALLLASAYGHTALVKALLKHKGAHLSSQTTKKACTLAAKHHHEDILQLLINSQGKHTSFFQKTRILGSALRHGYFQNTLRAFQQPPLSPPATTPETLSQETIENNPSVSFRRTSLMPDVNHRETETMHGLEPTTSRSKT